MTLPKYFRETYYGGTFVHSTKGMGKVYGFLEVKETVVTYSFFNGERMHTDRKEFKTIKSAERFAARFAAYMNRASARKAIPTLGTFRGF